MNKLEYGLLGGCAAVALGAGLLAPTEANAQAASPAAGSILVQQTAVHADAGSVLVQNTRTSCSTTQDSVANLTLTVPALAGNFFYLTGFYGEAMSNGTGSGAGGSATVFSTANMPGSMAILVGGQSAASSNVVNETYGPGGIKSSAAGTAVTFTPNATTASTYLCVRAVGFYAPQ